jgi:hypothetical protein
VEEIVVWWGWLVADLIRQWWWGVGVGLMMDMVEWGFLSLPLLVKDINSILQLCEPRPLSVDMLLASLGALDCSLPSHDVLLLLSEPLNFLLDSDQLFLPYCFFFFGFFVPIMDLDLIKLTSTWIICAGEALHGGLVAECLRWFGLN